MKIAAKIDIDRWIHASDKFRKDTTDAVTKAVYDAADAVFHESQLEAPVDRGTLRQTGFVRYHKDARAEVIYPSEYARPIHHGTRPHMPPVDPLKEWAKRHAMPDPDKAGWAIAMKIKKKGTPRKPFLQRAIDRVLPRIQGFFTARIKAVVK